VGDELFFADFFFSGISDAEESEDEGGREGEESHERGGESHERHEYRDAHEGEGFGVIHGNSLRDQFTDNDRKIGDPTDRDDEREAFCVGSDERDSREHGGEARCYRRSTVRSGDDADEGDADLDRGEEVFWILEEREDDFRALIAFAREVFHFAFFRRDERDF